MRALVSRCTQVPEFALEGSFTALKCSNLASFCTQTPDRRLMNPKEIACMLYSNRIFRTFGAGLSCA
jgi:hypothetical protein